MKAKYRRIAYFATTGAILLGVITAVSLVTKKYELAIDSFLGRGEKIVTGNDEALDKNYIEFKTHNQSEALANAQDVTRRTAEEGMTLLKNKNNALPLAATEGVTVLGYYS